MYDCMFERSGFDYNPQFYTLNSEQYFSYLYSDETTELKRKLWDIFPFAPNHHH